MSGLTFVIEHSDNCQVHQWNTRLDEAKYKAHAQSMAQAIMDAVPGASVVLNQCPKEFHESPIYCQLIPNDDDRCPTYQIVPKLYAFEVSVNGVLLFSKLLSKMWPNYALVSSKCAEAAERIRRGQDISDLATQGGG